MKTLKLFLMFMFISRVVVFSQVAINTDGSNPDESAILDVKSNTKGFLPPRMPRAEISSITSPAEGLIIYCTDCASDGSGALCMFVGGNWLRLSAGFMEPTVTTTAVSSIVGSTAKSGGNVVADGGAAVTARGICWGTSQNPTTANSKTTDGTGTGSFTSSLTGLLPGSTYYVKAYAINSIGTTYGSQLTLNTPKK